MGSEVDVSRLAQEVDTIEWHQQETNNPHPANGLCEGGWGILNDHICPQHHEREQQARDGDEDNMETFEGHRN